MAVGSKFLNHLKSGKVTFEEVTHKVVYTAFDLAQTTKRKLSEIAKTVLVKGDGKYFLIVVPANHLLDFTKIKKILGVKKVSMAKEGEMKTKFKVKPGAITPFGTIHKVSVVIEKALLRTPKVLFGAGSFTESIVLKVKDFVKLEDATVGVVSKRDASKKDTKPAPKKKPKIKRVAKKKLKKRKAAKKSPKKKST